MAKASLSTQFRKVDVDELDENLFQDEQGEDGTESGPNESEVNSLILQYPFRSPKETLSCSFTVKFMFLMSVEIIHLQIIFSCNFTKNINS